MKTIYLVRHGESVINVSDVFVHPVTPPLTELGEEQAQKLAQRAKNIHFDVLLASPIVRTKQTAEAIAAATGHPIEYFDVFREREMPYSLIGKPKSDPEAFAYSEKAIRSSEGHGEKVEDSETFDELVARAGEALALLESRPEKSMFIVTHGYFLRIMVARMLFGPGVTREQFEPLVWGLRTKNTGITVLRHDPKDERRPWWLLVWNDHAHLG